MGNRMRTSEINGVSHHPQEGIPLVLRKRNVLQDFIKFSFSISFSKAPADSPDVSLNRKKNRLC